MPEPLTFLAAEGHQRPRAPVDFHTELPVGIAQRATNHAWSHASHRAATVAISSHDAQA